MYSMNRQMNYKVSVLFLLKFIWNKVELHASIMSYIRSSWRKRNPMALGIVKNSCYRLAIYIVYSNYFFGHKIISNWNTSDTFCIVWLGCIAKYSYASFDQKHAFTYQLSKTGFAAFSYHDAIIFFCHFTLYLKVYLQHFLPQRVRY